MNRRTFLAVIAGAPVVANGMPSATARKSAFEALARAAKRTREIECAMVINNAITTPEEYERVRPRFTWPVTLGEN